MDPEQQRLQRKKELDEMKKKVQEYKERNIKLASSKVPATKVSSPTTPAAAPQDFDSLMDSITQIVPTSPEPQTPPTATAPTATVPTAVIEQRYKPILTIQSLVIEIDIPPREIPTYTKATQTVDPEPTTPEDNPITSTPSKAKSKYQQLQQQSNSTSISIATDTQSDNNNIDGTVVEEEEEESKIVELDELEKLNIIESENFKSFFARSSKVIERALLLDDSIDILVDYTKTDDENISTLKELKLISTMSDERWSKNRSVTDINWSPKHPELVVTSYSANETGSHDPDGVVMVWSVNNFYQKPEYIFNCQSPVMTTFFSRFHPTLIVGGTYSGQIVVWDTRSKSTPVQRTPLSSVGHTHPVYSMNVIGSTNANSLISISTDGKMCSWHLDNLSQPVETLDLNAKTSSSAASGVSAASSVAVTSLVFPEGEMNSFYLGGEDGAIYQAHRHGSKTGLSEKYRGHHGPITSLDFHPSRGTQDFSSLFLSSSTDWTCRLWSTARTDSPVYSFEDYTDYVYDARWSPVHPSIFATGDGSGQLCIWDLNEETEAPIIRTRVTSRSINRLSWSADGKKLLVGDATGNLSLYDTSPFANPEPDSWNRFGEVVNKLQSKPLTLQDSPGLSSTNQDD